MGISTHILDTSRGRPAAGVHVILDRLEGAEYVRVNEGETDDDGRIKGLVEGKPTPGTYRLHFAVGAYFEALSLEAFFPRADITFVVGNALEHYHVPLLLSPFSFSTYRGS